MPFFLAVRAFLRICIFAGVLLVSGKSLQSCTLFNLILFCGGRCQEKMWMMSFFKRQGLLWPAVQEKIESKASCGLDSCLYVPMITC